MKGQKKTPKVPGFMRHVLAANVQGLMEKHFASSSNKPKALGTAAGVTLSTIQRVLRADHGPSLDTIEMIAAAFEMPVYQLLIPNLHLDNPQVVQGATKDEERMYRRWRKTGTVAITTGRFAPMRRE
jgi:hypothetical protein